MFEKAVRQKIRFDYKGQSSVEDLWDIPLVGLDEMFKKLSSELSDQKGESLLEVTNPNESALKLKIDLIKHVVKIRLDEQKAREEVFKNKERKQKILSIIAGKQDEELMGKSVDDLNKMIDDME